MYINTVDVRAACSTLIISDLFNTSFEDFKEEMKKCLTRGYGKDFVGNNFRPSKFSFLMASTNRDLHKIQDWLRELGFQETPEAFNDKNKSHVILFFVPVAEIMKTLDCKEV